MDITTPRPEYNRFTSGNFTIQEHVTTGNFTIYIIELLLCLIAIPTNVMFIVVLSKTCTIHKNLRVLLISTCVSDVLYAVSRYMILIPLLVAYLYNTEISSIGYCWFAKSLHHVVVGAPASTLLIIVVERSLASYLYQNYESTSCYQYGLMLTAFQWTYAFSVMLANQIDVAGTPRPYSRLPCQIEYSTGRCIAFFIALSIVFNIVSVLMFFKMVKFNRTLYRQRNFKLKNLTEIYQICENVKSVSLLIPILITMLVGNILSTILISINAIVYIAVRETPEAERATIMTQITGRGNEISQSYDICAILTKIAFCYAIRTHPALYKKWHTTFCHVKIRPRNVGERDDVMGVVDGKKLTFTVIEETQHHFDSLAEFWK